jgi:hypothetical protein
MKRLLITASLAAAMAIGMALTAQAQAKEFNLQEAGVHERMLYHRAVDAVIWAMPLMNSDGQRQGYKAGGLGLNDIGYFNPIQDWRMQFATPNNTTPYVVFYANVKDGPVVVEIPKSAKDVGIFGSIMDFWNRSLADVGAAGRDMGLGAKYLFVHKSYQGNLPPGYRVIMSPTYNMWASLRPIIKDASQENIDKGVALAKQIRIYPLVKADNPPENRYINVYGKYMNAIPTYDASFFERLHGLVQEEVVDDKDHIMMGMLATLGIEKGKPYKVDGKRKALLDAAAKEALQYMIELYHERAIPPIYEGKKWTALLPVGATEGPLPAYEYPSYKDYVSYGILYYAITTGVENYGAATLYMSGAQDSQARWLDGGKSYTLRVEPNVPVRNFWSINNYNLETASYITEMPKIGVASSDKGLQTNPNGSVTIYFGPKPPKGKEVNWAPTKAGERWFCLFRFYGPLPSALDGSYELNDIELVK